MNVLKKALKILLSGLFTLLVFTAYTQEEITIRGTIKDANNGDILPGVNITIKGTSKGVISDIDGNYSLTTSQGSVVVFSFIGYNNFEYTANQSGEVNISLEPAVEELEEILVIGYGTQKKADKTGAVGYVTAEEMNGGVITDPVQAVQGKISGVLITKKGGDPNSGFAIKIRGAAGFNSNTQPLFVIDGVPNADPTTIAPEDIESYSILKDAASSAIYGSQGSNGVVLITTKKGSSGKSAMQFSAKFSAEQVANTLDLLSASDIRKFASDNSLEFTDGGSNVNWQDQIYRTGFSQNYNVNYSGGTEKSSYYASVTRSTWEGVMRGTKKERTIGKINLAQKALNDKLTLSGSLSGTFEKNDYENYSGFNKDDIIYQALSHNPTDPVRDSTGNYYKTIRAFNYENPLAVINGIDNTRDAKRFFGSFKADLEILPGLVGSVNFGYTRDDHENSYFRPKEGIYATADNGFGKKEYNNNQQKLVEATGNYNKILDKHSINLMGGYSWQGSYWDGFYAQAENPQSDFIKYNNLGSFIDITSSSISSWAREAKLIGFFGRFQYNYDSKYYLSASLRQDGSTRFGENYKWGMFPTFSAGWNLSRESFMQTLTVLNQLKLRASYGISGNQKIGEYRSKVIFQPTGIATDPETGKQVTTFGPAWNANPDLRWEKTAETNIGIDFGLFANRLSGSLEVYTKLTTDLLGEYQVPVPPNLARTTYANSGNMRNSGIELFVQSFLLDNSNLKWKTSLNITHFKTIIGDLGDYVVGEVKRDGYITGRGLIGDQNYITGNIEGEELGAFYLPVYVGLSSDGYFLYKSETGGITRELNKARREIVGSPSPNLEIGWSNTLTFFKNWEIDFSLRSMIGNDVYNATRMFFDYPGLLPSLNAMPDALDWYEKGRTQSPTIADLYVENGSFLRLDYISLAYNLVPKDIAIKSLKVFLSSNNLFTLTKYTGIDPETTVDGLAFGIDQYNVYPKTRTFTFGITANF